MPLDTPLSALPACLSVWVPRLIEPNNGQKTSQYSPTAFHLGKSLIAADLMFPFAFLCSSEQYEKKPWKIYKAVREMFCQLLYTHTNVCTYTKGYHWNGISQLKHCNIKYKLVYTWLFLFSFSLCFQFL